MLRSIALGAAVLLTCAYSSFAGERWLRLRTPNFELYTTDDAKTGREGIRYFEQVRSAFLDILGVKLAERPVSIIAFRNADEYAPYRIHEGVIAYYMTIPHHDYIVVQDLMAEHHQLVLHEYTHLVVDQAGMKLPLWLNEGFAELYSTMTQVGGKILVGRMLQGRMAAAQGGLADLREIVTAGRNSEYYKAPDRQAIFYAESWALIHMLKFSKPYSSRIDRFLDAVGRGEPSDIALERIYEKPLPEIQKDLNVYVHGTKFNEGVIKARLEKVTVEPEITPADPEEMGVRLAEIQYNGPERASAVRRLQAFCAEGSGRLAACESLVWLSLGRDPQLAIEPFRRALTMKTQDAALCYEFAGRLRGSIADADYLAALRRAAEIKPEDSAVQKLLAGYAMEHKDYAEAFLRLRLVKKLDRPQAFPYYCALAYAAYQIGKADDAKAAAGKAQQYASSPQERAVAQQILGYVNGGGVPAGGSPVLPE